MRPYLCRMTTAMKRTPVSARFTRQLIKVNDQVCFSALRQWEFEQRLTPLVINRPTDFTPEVFEENPFSASIYRKIGDLPTFSKEAEQVALQMGVIASVEHSLAYLEEVQTFRQSLIKTEGDEIKHDAEEEQLRLKIERWSGKSPVSGHFRTVGYLRLLRNHYAHVNDVPHPSFKTYIRSYGTPLNKFWKNGVTDLHGIDFKTLETVNLTPDLTFGIMNVLRVSLRHIDEAVADTLVLADAVRFILDDIFKSTRNRQLRIDRILSKAKTRLSMGWNIDASLLVVTKEVENILAAGSLTTTANF
jgi:hypothetical protein